VIDFRNAGNNRFLAVRELKIQFFPLVAGPFLKVSYEFSGLKAKSLKRRSDQRYAHFSIIGMLIFQSVCLSEGSRYSLQQAKHLQSIQNPEEPVFWQPGCFPALSGAGASR